MNNNEEFKNKLSKTIDPKNKRILTKLVNIQTSATFQNKNTVFLLEKDNETLDEYKKAQRKSFNGFIKEIKLLSKNIPKKKASKSETDHQQALDKLKVEILEFIVKFKRDMLNKKAKTAREIKNLQNVNSHAANVVNELKENQKEIKSKTSEAQRNDNKTMEGRLARIYDDMNELKNELEKDEKELQRISEGYKILYQKVAIYVNVMDYLFKILHANTKLSNFSIESVEKELKGLYHTNKTGWLAKRRAGRTKERKELVTALKPILKALGFKK